MGARYDDKYNPAQPHFQFPDACFDIDDLKYHTSWDWLKPVVDEIFKYALAHPEQVKPIREMSIVVTINSCWEKVVQFIQWHNSNKAA